MSVQQTGPGRFRVVQDGRGETVYVAGPAGRRWAFWNGQLFREEEAGVNGPRSRTPREGTEQQIAAPMPATVLKVLAKPGSQVSRGDALVIIEAMKMELPLRASADAMVVSVRCREGDLVQPDTVLVELK